MMGKYDPQTWKSFAEHLPNESTVESIKYLEILKEDAAMRKAKGFISYSENSAKV